MKIDNFQGDQTDNPAKKEAPLHTGQNIREVLNV